MSLFVTLLFLLACAPEEPPSGFGVPDVSEEGLVDTDGDGDGDVYIEDWCPDPIIDGESRWYQANRSLAESVGFNANYSFRLRPDGEIPLCFFGEKETKPLWWACNDGLIDIYGGGFLGMWAGADDKLATVEWLGTRYDENSHPAGESVFVTSDGEFEEGVLWYAGCN